MSQEVKQTISFEKTPKDGKWYSIAQDQYIKWSADANLWNWMMFCEGDEKPRAWDQLPDGTELFGVEE